MKKLVATETTIGGQIIEEWSFKDVNSWKPEVQTDSTGKWYGNALRFATEKEALDNATDLSMRWYAVKQTRATESEDPVNYSYVDRQLVAIKPGDVE